MLVTRARPRRSILVDPASERRVVDGLRRGEAPAFDEAWEGFRARVFGYLARMAGRRDLAEDLLQETFLRLAARAPSLREDTRLGPWLFTVARNLYVSHLRTTLLDAERLDELALEDPGRVVSPFEEAAASELGKRVERALLGLPPSYREAILLVAVAGMEPGDAAEVVGITPEAFRQRLSRGRGMIEDALAERERRTG
jgi:RNA polymerase sigma factor (sigma-70 family)